MTTRPPSNAPHLSCLLHQRKPWLSVQPSRVFMTSQHLRRAPLPHIRRPLHITVEDTKSRRRNSASCRGTILLGALAEWHGAASGPCNRNWFPNPETKRNACAHSAERDFSGFTDSTVNPGPNPGRPASTQPPPPSPLPAVSYGPHPQIQPFSLKLLFLVFRLS
jgi:hypothetical protein